jgi:NAD(P)-dependent dehydrogenase (short-subunit alcohol dehydrogenase family)
MNLQLQDKTAFISGSTQGIGFSIAQQLLSEGAQVIINGRTQEKIDQAIGKLKTIMPDAKVSGIKADFSDETSVSALIDQLPDIDILINNVGIFELKSFFEITDMDWKYFFEVNVLSSVRLSRALMPKMLENNWGRIIFISSESGINIPENMIHYGMTKTAMLSVSSGLARLTKNTGVTVNTLIGGPTYSDGVANTLNQIAKAQNQPIESLKKYLIETINPTSLINRFIDPSEIASMAVYLASPLAIATNGAALRVDGGALNTIF